jgi:hypothetical protein
MQVIACQKNAHVIIIPLSQTNFVWAVWLLHASKPLVSGNATTPEIARAEAEHGLFRYLNQPRFEPATSR